MKNKIIPLVSYLIFSFFIFQSCRKEPGIGGEAKIYGKVYYKHYNSTFTTLINEGYLSDTYVYIVYGNNINYGQRIKTNYKGEFEFSYLYKGKYTVYTYGMDSSAMISGQLPINEKADIQTVDIKFRKEQIKLEDFNVFK